MSNQELLNRIAALEAMLGVSSSPNPMNEVGLNGLLVHARQIGNMTIDPVVDVVITGVTTRMPRTGHILSLPRPDLGEMFMGYCQRVSDQAKGNVATVGALFISSGRLFARFGGYRSDGGNWPEAADCFYNLRKYMTEDELKAADAAAASWGVVHERMRNQRRNRDGTAAPQGETPL